MWFDPGFGYHVDNTTGIATGNDPESICELPVPTTLCSLVLRSFPCLTCGGALAGCADAVMSGKNFNGGCCFD
eukprot:COSAG02_NODE_2881_length_7824_cov_3.474822_4_plen_73_part_00